MKFILSLVSLLVVSVGAVEEVWEDSETLSTLWSACSRRDSATVASVLEEDPSAVFARSADGRGALFWAYEFGHKEGIAMLERLGANPLAKDAHGMTPKQLGIDNAALNAQRDIEFAAKEDEYAYDNELEDIAAFGEDHFAEEDDDEYAEDEL